MVYWYWYRVVEYWYLEGVIIGDAVVYVEEGVIGVVGLYWRMVVGVVDQRLPHGG